MLYKPVYDQGVRVADDYKRLGRVLVDSPRAWAAMVQDWHDSGQKLMGFDTETAPLDDYTVKKSWGAAALSPEHNFLVGCSLAFGYDRGYYLPFGHRQGTNLPMSAFTELEKLLLATQMVVYWNAKFDLKIQRANGHSHWREIKVFDASILVWNADTNAGQPPLKTTARTVLGWDLPDYKAARGEAPDLSWLTPEETLDYAAYDALVPLYLTREFKSVWKSCRTVIDLDNKIVPIVLDMEDTALPVDMTVVDRVSTEIEPELEKLREEMRKLVGDDDFHPGKNCTSGAVRAAFEKLGVDTGVRTKSKQMSLSEDALFDVRHEHPFVQLILDYKELGSLSSKVMSFRRDYREDLGGLRFQYSINKVATGRFSSGNGKKVPYYAGFGIQNVIKAPKLDVLATPVAAGRGKLGEHTEILGWVFEYLRTEGRDEDKRFFTREDVEVVPGVNTFGGVLTEGFAHQHNLRQAFKPLDGHIYLHVDYAAEELRLPANLSRDARMVDIFTTGKDMHEITARALWGDAGYNYKARSRAKPINFGLLYGMGYKRVMERVGCSEQEARRYIEVWWSLYPGLRRWCDEQIAKGRTQGYVTTAFGRRRWVLRDYEKGLGWHAENESVNSPIQGTGGDMMRLALLKITKHVLPKYGDRLRMLSMVHDEINFSCDPSILWQVTDEIANQMTIALPGWQVPMLAEYEMGPSWGELYSFEKTDDGVWVPTGLAV